MVAAHLLNPRRGALALSLLILVSGCSQSPDDPVGPPESEYEDFISREGVNVEFTVNPVGGSVGEVTAGGWADVKFRVTDASTGDPIKGRYPAAWMDIGEAWESMGDRPMSCRDRVATYLQGIVGVRPMIDLNSHFLLVMNRDNSISVIDPVVGITGITNLFAQINLSRPGADWVFNDSNKGLFVSMPTADRVALVDTESFSVSHEIEAGTNPMRVELQADGRYLWVGNNADDAAASGVTIIDAEDLEPLAFVATGPGHHEIAFSDGDRFAFVTNREGSTVSVIDVQSFEKVTDIETGPRPMSIAYSALGNAVYVTDADTGVVTVIDPEQHTVRARITTEPGIGPLRFEKAGRWGMAVNASKDAVFVIDTSTNKLAHTISVGNKPYQVSFTNAFAYVRSLGTQDVGLIPLSELDEATTPPVTYIPAGQRPPGAVAEISIADSIIPAVKQAAAAYIVNQAEGTVSYYMEGMGAPMGNFRNYGHEARAIEIVDRSLAEKSPGVYEGRVKIPVEGIYDVAFMMDTPQFVHCFNARVVPNEAERDAEQQLAVEYAIEDRRVAAGESKTIQFRLTNTSSGMPAADVDDVSVMYYRSDGRDRTVLAAKSLGGGLYEVTVEPKTPATYYVFVAAPSKGLDYSDQPFLSLMALAAQPQARVEVSKQ